MKKTKTINPAMRVSIERLKCMTEDEVAAYDAYWDSIPDQPDERATPDQRYTQLAAFCAGVDARVRRDQAQRYEEEHAAHLLEEQQIGDTIEEYMGGLRTGLTLLADQPGSIAVKRNGDKYRVAVLDEAGETLSDVSLNCATARSASRRIANEIHAAITGVGPTLEDMVSGYRKQKCNLSFPVNRAFKFA